mmetsp:Transcript_45188/g.98273  ORF Transcript_45188/g.98273 Transcript_45188/m.98273 type:complete len:251 (-) Transcript_45188:7-759(-)
MLRRWALSSQSRAGSVMMPMSRVACILGSRGRYRLVIRRSCKRDGFCRSRCRMSHCRRRCCRGRWLRMHTTDDPVGATVALQSISYIRRPRRRQRWPFVARIRNIRRVWLCHTTAVGNHADFASYGSCSWNGELHVRGKRSPGSPWLQGMPLLNRSLSKVRRLLDNTAAAPWTFSCVGLIPVGQNHGRLLPCQNYLLGPIAGMASESHIAPCMAHWPVSTAAAVTHCAAVLRQRRAPLMTTLPLSHVRPC